MKMKEAAMATVSTYLVGDNVIDDLNWKVENKFADSKTDEVQFTCLGLAVLADMEKIIPSLLEAGANVNVSADLKSPLVCAADRGQTKILNCLMTSGADVNYHDSSGITALHSAARNGHIDNVKRLVKSGADVNKNDRNGYTPLMVVAENGHDNCVAQLIKLGADVNIADDMGNTALMWASMADQYKCVSALIEAEADVNKANNHGYVSLMCAAKKGDDQWFSDLIRAGADVNKVNKLGSTAFTIASSQHHEKCINVLTKEAVGVNTSKLHSEESIDGHECRNDDTIGEMVDVEGDLDTSESLLMNLQQECVLSEESDTAMKAHSME